MDRLRSVRPASVPARLLNDAVACLARIDGSLDASDLADVRRAWMRERGIEIPCQYRELRRERLAAECRFALLVRKMNG